MDNRGKISSTITLVIGVLILAFTPMVLRAKTIVIHAGQLIDGVADQPRRNVSIVIVGSRIAAIRDGFVREEGAEVIDLSQHTVLPGLIDCHDHLSLQYHSIEYMLTHTAVQMMPQAVVDAKKELDAGFTSVRDVGSAYMMAASLKEAINTGLIPGPRLWIALEALGPTGGHSDLSSSTDPDLSNPHWKYSIVDSPDEAVRAVRDHKKRGADLIKIFVTGGVVSPGDDPALQLMSDSEIEAVVKTAHALGMKVAAHAHGKAGIDAAVRLGVDSIEHATFADAGSFELFKKHGTYIVPTLVVSQAILKAVRQDPERLPAGSLAKIEKVAPAALEMLRAAHRSGVKIAFGTDSSGGVVPHGRNAVEFSYLVQAGLTPMEAIRSATSHAADLLGAQDSLGAIRPGLYADVIAVGKDPLVDITELERVVFVMKDGVVYRPIGPTHTQ